MSTTAIESSDHFNASITVDGAMVNIHAKNLGALLKTLTQFGYNDAALTPAPAPEVVKPGKSKAASTSSTTSASPPSPSGASEAPGKPAADAVAEPSSSNTPATPAATVAPASTTPPYGLETPRPDYNQIRAAVLAMAKVNQQLAKDTLAKFKAVNGEPVDHGNKLQLDDYPAFLAAAAEVLK